MRTPTGHRASLIAAFALAACGGPDAPTDSPALGQQQAALAFAPGACDASSAPVWIGVTASAACPTVPGWIETPLFDVPPTPLGGFCRYQNAGGGSIPLLIGAPLADLEPDCGVVAPQGNDGDDLSAQRAEVWNASFLDRLDLTDSGGHHVSLVVLDTAGAGISPSHHGPAMVRLAEQISQQPVIPRVAMPRHAGGIDWTNGGSFGSPGELARAIDDAAQIPGPLVLSLSLGWSPYAPYDSSLPPDAAILLAEADPEDDGTVAPEDTGVAAPVRAVYAALVGAVCRGALVVVSAGNDPVGRGEADALLPAAWATLPAPTPADCAEYGFGGPGATTPGRGLVEAAGGVDLADAPLDNARVDSTPRLVAPAENVGVLIGDRWRMFSGTSAAAVAVSAAAAVAWSHDIGLTAGEVAGALYEGGVGLGALGIASVCPPSGCDPIARISVCGAAQHVNPNVSCEHTPAQDPSTLDGVLEALPDPNAEMPTIEGVEFQVIFEVCGPGDRPCPAPFAVPPADTSPVVGPQPAWPGCSACALRVGDSTLVLEIEHDSYPLSDPLLTMQEPGGAWHIDLSSILPTMQGGDTAKITGLPIHPDTYKAWMTFTVQGPNGPVAKGNPIMVF